MYRGGFRRWVGLLLVPAIAITPILSYLCRRTGEGRMKLWYQSMSRQAEWGGYPAVLRSILDKVKDPGY